MVGLVRLCGLGFRGFSVWDLKDFGLLVGRGKGFRSYFLIMRISLRMWYWHEGGTVG